MRKVILQDPNKKTYILTRAELQSLLQKQRRDFEVLGTIPKGVVVEFKN